MPIRFYRTKGALCFSNYSYYSICVVLWSYYVFDTKYGTATNNMVAIVIIPLLYSLVYVLVCIISICVSFFVLLLSSTATNSTGVASPTSIGGCPDQNHQNDTYRIGVKDIIIVDTLLETLFHHITSHHITSHHITSHHITLLYNIILFHSCQIVWCDGNGHQFNSFLEVLLVLLNSWWSRVVVVY